MRLHARIGLMAMVALASQPADLFAKKRPKPVDAAAAAVRAESGPSASVAEIPALAKLLAKAGWTPTPEMSGYFKVGHIYRPTATGHSRVISDCFEATPTEDTYTSTEVVTQLQAGVGMEFAGMGGGISAGIVKKVKFGTPTHVSLSETDLFPTDDCRNKLNRLAGQQVDLGSLYVVQQVLMAEIAEQTCGRIDASGKFLMLGQAEAAYARACNQFSLEPVAVAYRTQPMAPLLGGQSGAASVELGGDSVDFGAVAADARAAGGGPAGVSAGAAQTVLGGGDGDLAAMAVQAKAQAAERARTEAAMAAEEDRLAREAARLKAVREAERKR